MHVNLYEVTIRIHRGLATGIYITNSPEACHFVTDHCKANVVVVEDNRQLQKILQVCVISFMVEL